MPTYDYICKKCEHEFEVFQSMKDDRLTDCPKDDCDGPVRRKIGTGAGLIFKGSGFYETDYRSESYKAAAKKDSEGGSSSTKSDTKKSDNGSSSTSSTSESKPSSTTSSTSATTTKSGGSGSSKD